MELNLKSHLHQAVKPVTWAKHVSRMWEYASSTRALAMSTRASKPKPGLLLLLLSSVHDTPFCAAHTCRDCFAQTSSFAFHRLCS